MNTSQHTLRKKISFSGIGIHTGQSVEMSFLPAPPGHGIKFQRIDLAHQPIIDATLSNVVDMKRNTIIGADGAEVWTVEHVLASLVGMEVDNILITLNACEAPIMDGSAKDFVKGIQAVGLDDQKESRSFLEIQHTISYSDKASGAEIVISPSDKFQATVMVDYQQHGYESQYVSLRDIKDFASEIAPCRTFCFLHELVDIAESSLGQGGSLQSGLILEGKHLSSSQKQSIIDQFNVNAPALETNSEGLINGQSFRFSNEIARHKLLDVMGDMALLGKAIKAHIMCIKPGHASNILFGKRVQKQLHLTDHSPPDYDPGAKPLMDVNRIKQVLPHKYPFLLIDKILHLDAFSVTGMKNLTYNEAFFQGHFPDSAVMPGVLQMEVMAQVGAVFLQNRATDPENYWTYLTKIQNFHFKKPVTPGDTLIVHCKSSNLIRRGHMIIDTLLGKGYVNKQIVFEGQLKAVMVRKNI